MRLGRIALLLLAFIAIAAPISAQGTTGGLLYASDFAQWTLPQGTGPANGTISWPSAAVCQVSSNGYNFVAPKVGRPLTIIDSGAPAHTETVTPTQVIVGPGGCSITAAMSYVHLSYTVKSGTAGLQEAIDYQSPPLPGSLVILTPPWTLAGGSTGMITSAHGSTVVSILDARVSCLVAYGWTGSAYVSTANFCTGGGGTVGPGTVGTLAKFGPTTTAIQDSHINESTPGVETITQKTTISDPSCPGCAGVAIFQQGTGPSFASGNGYIFSDASGNMMSNDNATGSGHICNSVNGQCPTGMSGMTATQVPIAATASTVTSSKPLAGAGAGITTGPTSSTNGHCAQFTGTSGQIADSGGACGGGGGSATAAPPYLEIGSTFYLPQDGMYAVTKPPSSPVWINSLAPGTITNGTNGDILYTTAGTNTFYWQEQSGSSSVESVLQLISANTGSGAAVGGVWLWDSTNSLIYTMVEAVNTGTGAGQSLEIDSFSYNGSGNPSSGVRVATIVGTFNGWASQFVHMKMVKSGSSILFQISPNGGQNFTTVFTQTGIGTIADGGISLLDGSTFPTAMDVASEVVQ